MKIEIKDGYLTLDDRKVAKKIRSDRDEIGDIVEQVVPEVKCLVEGLRRLGIGVERASVKDEEVHEVQEE